MGSRYESGVNTMGVLSRTEQKLVEDTSSVPLF